jgi:hypothetical protein
MATLVERVTALVQAVGAEIKALRARTGTAYVVASGSAAVTTNAVSASVLAGFSGVTRVSAGKLRFTFTTAQPDTSYMPFCDVFDSTVRAARVVAKTTTYVEVQVMSITSTPAAADAAETSLLVVRKVT